MANLWLIGVTSLAEEDGKRCQTKREAEDCLAKVITQSNQAKSEINTKITLAEYSKTWIKAISSRVKPQSAERYQVILDTHILPSLGKAKVVNLHRARVKRLLLERIENASKATADNCYQVLHNLMNEAVDDNLLPANPLSGLGRRMKMTSTTKKKKEVKAFDAGQLFTFLDHAEKNEPKYYPVFATLAWTGIRVGESMAVEWKDILWKENQAAIVKNMTRDGRIDTPKSDSGERNVDLADEVMVILQDLYKRKEQELLENSMDGGVKDIDGRVFTADLGDKPNTKTVRNWLKRLDNAMNRILKDTGLPQHHSIHSLRHTYASLLLQDGTPIQYVQQQLGHSTIQLTVDLYGRWLKKEAPGAINRMVARVQNQSGSNTVADIVSFSSKHSK